MPWLVGIPLLSLHLPPQDPLNPTEGAALVSQVTRDSLLDDTTFLQHPVDADVVPMAQGYRYCPYIHLTIIQTTEVLQATRLSARQCYLPTAPYRR